MGPARTSRTSSCPAALLYVPLSALGHRLAYNAPRAPVVPARRARRRAPGPALRDVTVRRRRRRRGVRLRAVPGRRAPRGPSGGARVSAGPARAVGRRGRARGIARERPRRGRRPARARDHGAPLRVLRGARAAAVRAGADRASPRGGGSASRSARRSWLLAIAVGLAPAYGALGALAHQGWQAPLAVRSRSGRRSRCSRSRSGRRSPPGSSRPRVETDPRIAARRSLLACLPWLLAGPGRDRTWNARRGRPTGAAAPPRGVARHRMAAMVVAPATR